MTARRPSSIVLASLLAATGAGCDDSPPGERLHADSGWDGGRVCVRCDASTLDATRSGRDAAARDADDAGREFAYTGCTRCDTCEEHATMLDPARHVEGDIDYADPPPTGGSHNRCWADWGVHVEAVQAEHWVHNLEHGGVVFLYRCPDGCADAVAALASFVDAHDRTILTPAPTLPARFAFVSWGYRLLTDCDDIDAAREFYDAHVDRAPESEGADPPADCP